MANTRSLPPTFEQLGRLFCATAVVTTTRSTLKIEDPPLSPGRVDFRAPDGGLRLKGALEPKIRRDPSQHLWNLVCGPPLYSDNL